MKTVRTQTTGRKIGRPLGSGKYHEFVGCRVPQKQGEFLTAVARNKGLRKAAVLREALDFYMRRYNSR